jgi:cytochrome c oxidase subunit 2
VIHSWVPKLTGETDHIPSRSNRMWFKADEPGTYSGQCAELCGIGHAGMRFKVIAQSQEDFDAWVQEQLAGNPPDGGQPSGQPG